MGQLSFDFIDTDDSLAENDSYLSNQIITYLGNKRQLLSLIEYGVSLVREELGKERLACLDLFSGSGVVARMLKQYASALFVNDLERYSEVINRCYLSNSSEVDRLNLDYYYNELISRIESEWCSNGFISELYAPKDDNAIMKGERVFYTRRNAEYLDTARQQIATLPEDVQVYFLAPLLASASVHTNTSGVFKGFYKDKSGVGCFGGAGRNALTRILGDISVSLPVLSCFECPYSVYRGDARETLKVLPHVDVAYLDPPYNQHPYGSNYFMLNLLVDYQRPQRISNVSGIPTDWNRSLYNKAKYAKGELFSAIDECDATYVIISYNSEGFVAYDEFTDYLQTLGDLRTIETKYNTFRGSRNLRNRDIHVKEYLFLLRKGSHVS